MRSNQQTRDFTYVDDVTQGLLLIGGLPTISADTFNLSTGTATTVKDAVEKVLQLLGNPVKMHPAAAALRPGEISEQSGDSSLAKELLQWSAETSLDEGLAKTIDWWKVHLELKSVLVQA
jgi:nucleoside-diphosphate-sugar epimerase